MAYPCQSVQRLLENWHRRSNFCFALQKVQWAGLHYLEREPIDGDVSEALVWFAEFLERVKQVILHHQSLPLETTDLIEQMTDSFQRRTDQQIIDLLPTMAGRSRGEVITLLREVTQGLLRSGRGVDPLPVIPDNRITDWLDCVRAIGQEIIWRG